MGEARSLPHLLDRAARADPSAPAVSSRGRTLSYGDLDALAARVASGLAAAGVRPGDRVALLAAKSCEVVAALYGVMRAGAAYVPLDPYQPVVRAAAVAADCTVRAVVTTSQRAHPLLAALVEAGHRPDALLLLDGGPDDGPARDGVETVHLSALGSGWAPEVPVGRDDLAYVLYTSGSTGRPKGVMLTHGNALAFVEWSAREIGSRPADRFSSHAPFHFDLSVFDLYVPAVGGGAVVLVPEEEAYLGDSLVRFIREEAISVWYSVPTALTLLTRVATEPLSLPSLRAVVFAGEVYPTPHLRQLRALVPDATLWNLYGPTETNVCTAYRVEELPKDDAVTIPIGWPCSGDEAFAVTAEGRVAAAGQEGELLVRGPTVMRGYWNRPERTAEVLIANPLTGDPEDPVYRTGDLVRSRPDGAFEFVGRRDHQIKSRGYRIELGEIEAALHGMPGVDDAVAVAIPHPDWGSAILAYVVPAGGAELREIDVKRHIAARLPRYMIPTHVRVTGVLPRTSTGKIDRRALGQTIV